METFTEDKNHANPEPTQPLHTQPAHHTHTTQRSNAAGAARKGPCPRSQKRFVLLGKHIAREAGDGLGSSMGPFPYHLVHISLGHPSLYPVPTNMFAQPATHTSRALEQVGPPSTIAPLPAARLLKQGTACPLRCRQFRTLPTNPRTLHTTRSYLATGADLPMVVLLYY